MLNPAKFLIVAAGLASALSIPILAQSPTPGVVTGRVVDGTGKPLAGAVVHLQVRAVSGPPFQGKTDANGTYAIKMSGFNLIYKAHGWMPLKYRDKIYCMWVAPETDADTADFAGRDGAIRNFRWKVSGDVDPSGLTPLSDSSVYGGTLRLFLSFEDGDFGGSIDLVLTPDGPLIDGSQGKVLTLHVDPAKSLFLYDIPIGAYKVKATRTKSNGERTAVRLGPSARDAKPEALLEFKPHDTVLACGSAATDNGIDRAFLTVTGP